MKYIEIFEEKRSMSRLGLGCMRFARIKNADGTEVIDEQKAISLIRKAIDSGINYIDTAYCYDGSEVVVGKALQDGYREKVTLVTKLAVWEAKSYEDYERLLDEQLRCLQTNYIDIYLLHGMSQDNWEGVINHNGLGFLDQMVSKGKIRYRGFSIHADFNQFKKVIDAYNWDLCMIQLNYLDEHHQAGVQGLKYASSKGIPVAIMEPQKGGLLSSNLPIEAKELIENFPAKRSAAEWAFRWLYSKPEVSVILSGLNTIEQLEENIRIFDQSEINSLTTEENDLINNVKEIISEKVKIGCTGCAYCMPCAKGVNIPEVFKVYNDSSIFNNIDFQKVIYSLVLKASGIDASKCIECGKCEKMCPQKLDIINGLKEAHSVLN